MFDHMLQRQQFQKYQLELNLFTKENPDPFSAHVYFPFRF